MSLAFARNYIRSAETGLAFGLIETANGFAVILAPLVAGNLYNANPRSMYAVSLGFIAILVLANLGIRFGLIRGKTTPDAGPEPS